MAQGHITEPKSKDDVNELCHINVGGYNYEISRNTMLSVAGSRLHQLAQDRQYISFFERPRTAFESILAYHQTGQLHMPGNLCPGVFKQEMEFWNVNPHVMENCCYHRYVTFVREQTILNGFLAKTLQAEEKLEQLLSDRSTRIARLRARMWTVLDNKDDSGVTKAYFCVATAFILMAIFATALGTLPYADSNSTVDTDLGNTTQNDTFGLTPGIEGLSHQIHPNNTKHGKGRAKRAMIPKHSLPTLVELEESVSTKTNEYTYISEQQEKNPANHFSVSSLPVLQHDKENNNDHGKQTDIDRQSQISLVQHEDQQVEFRKKRDKGEIDEQTQELDEPRTDQSKLIHSADGKTLSPHTILVKEKHTEPDNLDNDKHQTSQYNKQNLEDDKTPQRDSMNIYFEQGGIAQHTQGNHEQNQKEYLDQHQKRNDERLEEHHDKNRKEYIDKSKKKNNKQLHQENRKQNREENFERHQQRSVNELESVLFSNALESDEYDRFHESDVKSEHISSTRNTFNENQNELISGIETERSQHIRKQRSLTSVDANTTGYVENITENVENVTGDVTNVTRYTENITESFERVTQVAINVTMSLLNVTAIQLNDSTASIYPTGNVTSNSSQWSYGAEANSTTGMDAGNDSFFNTNMSIMRVNMFGIFGNKIESVKDVIDTILPEAPTSKVLTIETAMDEEQLTYMYIEYATNIFFTGELFLRLLCCPRAMQYIFSFQNVIDMLVLAAVYIRSLFFLLDREDYQSDIDILLYLQMLRVLRLLRLLENVTAYKVLCYTMKVGKNDIFLMLLYVLIGVLFFSNFIYFFERNEDFPSIPDSWWWSMVTMTTVGYGDMVPKTFIGKIIGSVCALSGVFMFSLIIPIFVNTFLSIYQYAEVRSPRTDLPRIIHTKKQNSYKVREQSV